MLLLTFTYFGSQGILSLAATEDLRMSTALAGVALTVGAISWSLTSLLMPRYLKHPRVGARRLAVAGAGLIVCATGCVLGALLAGTSGLPAAVLLWVAWGVGSCGMGMAYNSVALVALNRSSQRGAASAAVAVVLAETVGGCIAGTIGGGLVAVSPSVGWVDGRVTILSYGVFLASAVVLVLVALRMRGDATVDGKPAGDTDPAAGEGGRDADSDPAAEPAVAS
jgi:hypothetical protein